ncbi:hypothetical protein AK972_1933 [Pseudomonas yamanorum]|nr:hypothetical protein AK972_1933 [Pseudomonas yamanorum]
MEQSLGHHTSLCNRPKKPLNSIPALNTGIETMPNSLFQLTL